jgi:hypothetical protein
MPDVMEFLQKVGPEKLEKILIQVGFSTPDARKIFYFIFFSEFSQKS